MRMDVNGDGTLTKREMLGADEFSHEEVALYNLVDLPKSFEYHGYHKVTRINHF